MSEPSASRTTPSSPVAPSAVTEEHKASEQLAQSLGKLPAAPISPEDEARERIALLEREAKAYGHDPAAALLFHEIGLLWEDPLKNPRNAAVAFQNAYKLSPKLVPNIRAARRLFAEVGNWQMVIQLIDAELLALDDDRPRAALLFEKGVVLEERLSREGDAIGAYTQALALVPKDVTLLIQLESVFTAKGHHRSLVEVYRLLAAALEDTGSRAYYLTAAGCLLEERLKNLDEAATCYREAFALDRRDLLLLSAMKRLAEREERHEELLSALAAEAEVLGPQAAPTFLRIAKVYAKLDRKEDALAALLAARRVNPNEPLVLSELADIYQREARYEDLADVLLSWVSSISDESEHVAINLRLAALYEQDLKRDDDAIARYRAILQKVPGHTTALASLGKLYFRNQNWEGLVTVFDAEAAASEDTKSKAAKVYKAAEVLEERLARTEDAVARYNLALQLQPGYLPAQKALTRIYEKQGRFAELVAMYEQDLLQTVDREQIVATLNKMALFYEERLSDLDRAIDCYRRILELESNHLPTMGNLARLYELAGKWRELIALNEEQAATVGDTKQVLSLHHRNAEILDEQLKDRAGAIVTYERLLQLSPSYLPALKSLGRLYAQDGRWGDLIKMYRAEAEISPSTEHAASLIHKIGELYESRLKDENEAIASYSEVLTLAPSYVPALRALGRIHRAHGSWENLIEVLRSEAATRTDPVERANALYQAAAIWEDHLGRPELAVEGYQEVLRITPGHVTALRALERLYSASDDTKELIAILDRETQTGQTAAAKTTAYLKLARIYLDRLNEPSRAAQCCEAVLGIDAGNLVALRLLERIRAGDKTRRAELKTRVAERVTDPRLKLALRLAASSDQDKSSSESNVEDIERAFDDNPLDPRPFAALEKSYRLAQAYPKLVSLYQRKAEASTDAAEKLALTLRAAELAEQKLADLERATLLLRAAHELRPTHLPVVQGLRRVALKAHDLHAARRWLEEEGKLARDGKVAVEAFVAAGKLAHERLNDPEGAAAHYRHALDRDPLDPTASAALEDLLASRGGASDLAALQERRAEAKLAHKDLGAAAQEFLAAARIRLEMLHSPREGDRAGEPRARRPADADPRARAQGAARPRRAPVRRGRLRARAPGAAGRRRADALRAPPQARQALSRRALGPEPRRRASADRGHRRSPERRGARAARGAPHRLAQLDRRGRLPEAAARPRARPRRSRPPHPRARADPGRGLRRRRPGDRALPPRARARSGRPRGPRAAGRALRAQRQHLRAGHDARAASAAGRLARRGEPDPAPPRRAAGARRGHAEGDRHLPADPRQRRLGHPGPDRARRAADARPGVDPGRDRGAPRAAPRGPEPAREPARALPRLVGAEAERQGVLRRGGARLLPRRRRGRAVVLQRGPQPAPRRAARAAGRARARRRPPPRGARADARGAPGDRRAALAAAPAPARGARRRREEGPAQARPRDRQGGARGLAGVRRRRLRGLPGQARHRRARDHRPALGLRRAGPRPPLQRPGAEVPPRPRGARAAEPRRRAHQALRRARPPTCSATRCGSSPPASRSGAATTRRPSS